MTFVRQPAVALPVGLPRPAAALRDSIEVARIALVVGLVFLHYFNFPNDGRPPFQGIDPVHHPLATFVNGFLTFFFFSAVPLLSAVSGWLFFGFTGDARAAIALRIRDRARSLLLPLMVWNLLALAVAAVTQWAIPTSGFAGQFNLQTGSATAWDFVNGVLGLTGLPIAFQFWFVRDLFVTVLVSPVLWLVLRHAPWAGAALLGAGWLAGLNLGIFIRTDVVFFFYLGALARRQGIDPRFGANTTLALMSAYVVATTARTLAPLVLDLADPAQAMWLDVATRLARPLGVLACWGACQWLAVTGPGAALARFGGFAFFLHAAHYPAIALVKDALWRVTPVATDAWLLVHYGASVALTMALVWAAAWLLFRLSPSGYSLLAGGRRLA